ncbi:MAG: hypothetical protein IKI99_03800, partial [Firmicutes bacterium]|nr:hypothetical protein [Bacillota bacterium]
HKKNGTPISLSQIVTAVEYLYGSWDAIDTDSKFFIQMAVLQDNIEEVYASVAKEEEQAKHLLVEFEKKYENVANASNVDQILKDLKNDKDKRPSQK